MQCDQKIIVIRAQPIIAKQHNDNMEFDMMIDGSTAQWYLAYGHSA